MILFSVNGEDYSEFVQRKGYSVNQNDEYGNTKWTDANYVTHRSVVRKKVSGGFNMLFTDVAKYNEFIGSLNTSKSNAYNPISIYVNNANEIMTINAYITIKTKTGIKTDAFGGEWGIASVEVTVEER